MKKIIFILIATVMCAVANAQVPYFGTSTGKGEIYSYYQVKHVDGADKNPFYTSLNYGLTNRIDVAANFNQGDETFAVGGKVNLLKNPAANIGIQPMVAFNTIDSYKFDNVTTGTYINGYIYKGFNYIINNWYSKYDGEWSWDNWTYIGYDFGKLALYTGVTSDLRDDLKSDLVLGAWYPISDVSYVYLWAGNLTKTLGDTKFTVGIDFKF